VIKNLSQKRNKKRNKKNEQTERKEKREILYHEWNRVTGWLYGKYNTNSMVRFDFGSLPEIYLQ